MRDLEDKVLNKLKEVIDPELGYDIVSLGEIEEIKVEDKKVYIKFLPTTPLCPFLPFIYSSIVQKMEELGLEAEVNIDYEGRWSIDRVDPEIRKKLNI
ncbi:metal-sulfur cluster assembly factor [Nanoarchaeota archaeon NZ13-N]|nr:MAG: metal-sulfur cluster assembly factor [Nanoarchaeota archaeon NZ13-N]